MKSLPHHLTTWITNRKNLLCLRPRPYSNIRILVPSHCAFFSSVFQLALRFCSYLPSTISTDQNYNYGAQILSISNCRGAPTSQQFDWRKGVDLSSELQCFGASSVAPDFKHAHQDCFQVHYCCCSRYTDSLGQSSLTVQHLEVLHDRGHQDCCYYLAFAYMSH